MAPWPPISAAYGKHLYTTNALCYLACTPTCGHMDYGKDCAAVMLFTAENVKVALDAIQCLGGNGYINDYPTGRFLRDAKLYEIGAGTSEVRRIILGRAFNNMYLNK